MQRSTYFWMIGGLALMGTLVAVKWEMARNRSAAGTNVSESSKTPSEKGAAKSDLIAPSNAPVATIANNARNETQDLFGAVVDVAVKAGQRAGQILSTNPASAAGGGNIGKTQDPVGSLLALAADTGRQLDKIGLEQTQLTDQEEIEIGDKMDVEILQEMPEASDPQNLARLQQLARSLVEQRKRRGIEYRIRIVQSSMVNAFGAAGGRIYFTTAFLRRFTTDGERAMTLGHEIAHIELKHAAHKVQYQNHGQKVVGEAAGIGQMVYNILSAPYSNDQEFEADAAGFDACRKAGWSSSSLLLLFDNFSKLERESRSGKTAGKPSELEQRLGDYFSSHPPTAERLARLKKRAGE